MSKVIFTALGAIASSIALYAWNSSAEFVYGNFIGIIALVSVVGTLGLGFFMMCKFKSVESSALRSQIMLFCNLMLAKRHISSADIAYLHRLNDDRIKCGLNGYLKSNIESVIDKHKGQNGEER